MALTRTSTGRYRINAVATMTGVPSSTLRAWERRYGVPMPDRSDSSYRLYSEADVDKVRRMQALVAEGVSAAEAARQVRREAERPPAELAVAAGDSYELAKEHILAAVEAFDPDAISHAVRSSLVLGSAPIIYRRVLAPALEAIGERWVAGSLSVAQEHLATQVLGTTIRQLLDLIQPERGPRVVLACFVDEQHTLPLYGAAFQFVRSGFRPVMLGARTPPAAVADAIERLEPAAVGLSLTIPPTRKVFEQQLAAYREAVGTTPWILGGRGVDGFHAQIDAAGAAWANGAWEKVHAWMADVGRASGAIPLSLDE